MCSGYKQYNGWFAYLDVAPEHSSNYPLISVFVAYYRLLWNRNQYLFIMKDTDCGVDVRFISLGWGKHLARKGNKQSVSLMVITIFH